MPFSINILARFLFFHYISQYFSKAYCVLYQQQYSFWLDSKWMYNRTNINTCVIWFQKKVEKIWKKPDLLIRIIILWCQDDLTTYRNFDTQHHSEMQMNGKEHSTSNLVSLIGQLGFPRHLLVETADKKSAIWRIICPHAISKHLCSHYLLHIFFIFISFHNQKSSKY